MLVSLSDGHELTSGQSLAALDMVFNAARLLSPILLGTVYAVFAEMGRPEMLFLVAGVSYNVLMRYKANTYRVFVRSAHRY